MVMGRVVFKGKQSSGQSAGSRLGGFAVFVLLVFSLFATTAAQAVPYIPFDAATISDGNPNTVDYSYGFVDPLQYPAIQNQYGSLSDLNEISQYYQASRSDHLAAGSSLLLVDQVGDGVGCPSTAEDNCSSTYNVFDIVWEVTFNAEPTGDLTKPYDVHLILVDSDPSAIWMENIVSIDYGSALLGSNPSDLQALDFQTASLNDSYFFIDLELGNMMHNQTTYVGFRYRVLGAELPPSEGDSVGLGYPLIVPGAYIATPIPEPSAAVLLGLGLAALALVRNRA